MDHQMLAKLAASTLVLGVTMVGCKPAADGSRPRSASQSNAKVDQQAQKAATAALNAAQKQDWAEGVAQAENAVALSPRDAGYRMTLGEIYLKSGRFQSAASAFTDALTLNPGDGKATLSLALTQIALGRNGDAIATLGVVGARIAPADHGLALALAGDKEGAIRLLAAAAREPGANGRLRQNLALAYAMAGDWTQARAVAQQDISPAEIDERLASWAAFAQPKAASDQVATLLGVTPSADAGQPTRLALSPQASPSVQTALAEPVGVPMAVAPATEVAAAETFFALEPAAVAEAAPVEIAAAPAPVFAAAVAAVEQVLPRQIARPLAHTIRAAAPAPAALKGRYVVQLGAFASSDRVERAWNGAIDRYDRLANYIPASTRITVGRGTSLTRLSVGGFPTRQGAVNLCEGLRRAGGACFVRQVAGDSRVRWASRTARNG